MKIGITYNLKDEAAAALTINPEYSEEFDSLSAIEAIAAVLHKRGYETVKLDCGIEIAEKIKSSGLDFVFNLAEGYFGRNRESQIPAVLEMFGLPYSGSDPLTLGVTLDKIMTKKIARQAAILVPAYVVIEKPEDNFLADKHLHYPVVVKPAWEGSSKGVYNSSKVYDRQGLDEITALLRERYPFQPLLVEEYIQGKEITVGIVGNRFPHLVGVMEITNKINPQEDFFYSLEVKRNWRELVDYIVPPDLSFFLRKRIEERAISIFKEFSCRDFARIDFRVSPRGEIFLLEINPLAGLSPEYSDLVIMAGKRGITYDELILDILDSALTRCGLSETKPIRITNFSKEIVLQ